MFAIGELDGTLLLEDRELRFSSVRPGAYLTRLVPLPVEIMSKPIDF